MNERQRELKRQHVSAKKQEAVSPEIDCLMCDNCFSKSAGPVAGIIAFTCGALGGKLLLRVTGAASLDFLNAPAECPRRAS